MPLREHAAQDASDGAAAGTTKTKQNDRNTVARQWRPHIRHNRARAQDKLPLSVLPNRRKRVPKLARAHARRRVATAAARRPTPHARTDPTAPRAPASATSGECFGERNLENRSRFRFRSRRFLKGPQFLCRPPLSSTTWHCPPLRRPCHSPSHPAPASSPTPSQPATLAPEQVPQYVPPLATPSTDAPSLTPALASKPTPAPTTTTAMTTPGYCALESPGQRPYHRRRRLRRHPRRHPRRRPRRPRRRPRPRPRRHPRPGAPKEPSPSAPQHATLPASSLAPAPAWTPSPPTLTPTPTPTTLSWHARMRHFESNIPTNFGVRCICNICDQKSGICDQN